MSTGLTVTVVVTSLLKTMQGVAIGTMVKSGHGSLESCRSHAQQRGFNTWTCDRDTTQQQAVDEHAGGAQWQHVALRKACWG